MSRFRRGRPKGGMRNAMERGDPRKAISYLPVSWHRADRGVTLAATKASAIGDQFGNGNDYTQSTDANRATLSSAGFNGKACLDYGSSGSIGYESPSVSFGAHSYIAILQGDATSGASFTAANDGGNLSVFGNNNVSSTISRGGVTTGKNVTSTWIRDSVKKTVSRTFAGTHASHLVYVNGRDTGATLAGALSGDPGTSPTAGKTYLGSSSTFGTGHKGLIAEDMLFGAAVPADLMWRIVRGRNAFYGIASP